MRSSNLPIMQKSAADLHPSSLGHKNMQAKYCWPPHVFQLEAGDMPTCRAPDVPACPCLPTRYADMPSCRCREAYSTHCQAGIKHQGMKDCSLTALLQMSTPLPTKLTSLGQVKRGSKHMLRKSEPICKRKPTLLKPKCISQLEALALLVVSGTRYSLPVDLN